MVVLVICQLRNSDYLFKGCEGAIKGASRVSIFPTIPYSMGSRLELLGVSQPKWQYLWEDSGILYVHKDMHMHIVSMIYCILWQNIYVYIRMYTTMIYIYLHIISPMIPMIDWFYPDTVNGVCVSIYIHVKQTPKENIHVQQQPQMLLLLVLLQLS